MRQERVIPMRQLGDIDARRRGLTGADAPPSERWRCGACHWLQAVGSVEYCELCGAPHGQGGPAVTARRLAPMPGLRSTRTGSSGRVAATSLLPCSSLVPGLSYPPAEMQLATSASNLAWSEPAVSPSFSAAVWTQFSTAGVVPV